MESSGRKWRKVVAVWVHITFLLDHVVVSKIADINYMYLYMYIYIFFLFLYTQEVQRRNFADW